jgi:hypothetical protein
MKREMGDSGSHVTSKNDSFFGALCPLFTVAAEDSQSLPSEDPLPRQFLCNGGQILSK